MVRGPELRTDPLSGHRVVAAPDRAARPGGAQRLETPEAGRGGDTCPFCAGRESETPPELYAVGRRGRGPNGVGWRVRLFPNKFPALGDWREVECDELFRSEPAVGTQNVLADAPEHRLTLVGLEPERLAEIAAAWRWRAIESRPPGTAYTHVVVNEGARAGASLPHSHPQISSLPFVAPRVEVELERQAAAESCLACDLARAELAHGSRVVANQGGLLAYCPHAGRLPYETIVTPVACEADAFTSELLAAALGLAIDVLAGVRGAVGWAHANLWLTTAPWSSGRIHWRLTVAPRLTTAAGLELGVVRGPGDVT